MSNRFTTAVVVALALAGSGSAFADGPASMSFRDVLASGGLTVPAAWSGVWDITDTTRACGGAVTDTDAEQDTLCTGDSIEPDTDGFPATINCTGTVNDTVVDVDCTGSWNFPPDCTATITIAMDGTRTGETYVVTNSLSVVYSGSLPCTSIPDICTVTTTHGTRVAPEPASCTTAVEPSTWGQVKSSYR